MLNILIFAGIYHQRDRGKTRKKKKEQELAEAGSCSSSSGEEAKAYERYEQCKMSTFECNYIGSEKKSLECVQMTELPLQEFHSSPKRNPPDVTSTSQEGHNVVTSPSIPEPPPPPKNQPPVTVCNQAGILRPHGAPTTPGTMKKRVQIQEISV